MVMAMLSVLSILVVGMEVLLSSEVMIAMTMSRPFILSHQKMRIRPMTTVIILSPLVVSFLVLEIWARLVERTNTFCSVMFQGHSVQARFLCEDSGYDDLASITVLQK